MNRSPGVLAFVLLLLVACGGPAESAQSSPAVATSPSPDSTTSKYVAVIHKYWIDYKTAEGDPPRFIKVCWGKPVPGTPSDPNVVDPAVCQQIGEAIITPHGRFLSDLNSTPPPPRFVSDDQAFRKQLPLAIAHIKAMIGATRSGDRQAVIVGMTGYVHDMIPIVTKALDDIDPSVVHD